MKRLFLLTSFLFVSPCVFAGSSYLVQAPGMAGGASGTILTSTFSISTTNHDTVWVAFGIASATVNVSSIIDGCGDIFVQAPNSPVRGTGNSVFVYTAPTIGGCTTVEVQTDASAAWNMSVGEYTSMDNASIVDCGAGGTGNSTALLTSSCSTASTQIDVLIAFGFQPISSATYTAGSGYSIQNQNSGTGHSALYEDKDIFAEGSYTGLATSNTSGQWTIHVLAMKSTIPTVTIDQTAPPVLIANAQTTFTASVIGGGGVTWSCPGCAGSINSGTGVYTAPATITASQSIGGYQLLPNDHIYNTRIDSLPVNGSSAAWIAGAGTAPINYLPDYQVNYTNNLTPTQGMVFFYTPLNNAAFQVPAYPGIHQEGGWFSQPFGGRDRHIFTADTATGIVQDMYNYYSAGTATFEGCPTCTSQSGVKYASSTYDLPINGSTNAGGTLIVPLLLRLQELEQAVNSGGTIKHALSMTLQNAFICGTSVADACGGNISGTRYIWPATNEAFAGGGVVPYGARFRLKSSFNCATFSSIAQILCTQMKQYGLILTDGGLGWQVTIEGAKWPPTYLAAINEITSAHIATSNWEGVDESSLEELFNSGKSSAGEVVVATSNTSPTHKSTQHVVLTGVTINVPNDNLFIQANTSAQQLTAYARGGATNTVTWAMSPAIGSLTSGGLFTPPGSIAAPGSSTTVTITSVDDSAVKAYLTLYVLPTGTIRLIPGRTTNYTDDSGHAWLAAGGDSGSIGCCGDLSGGPWPAVTDIGDYYFEFFPGNAGGNDLFFDFTVPDGFYLITVKLGTDQAPTLAIDTLEAQGSVIYSNVDVNVAAGGTYKPINSTIVTPVIAGHLQFVVRQGTTASARSIINALQIDFASSLAGGGLSPGSTLSPGVTIQ